MTQEEKVEMLLKEIDELHKKWVRDATQLNELIKVIKIHLEKCKLPL